jgi:hypothetical protein
MTWSAWSGIQLVADVGDSATLTASISGVDGNPLPSLAWAAGVITGVCERARKTTGDSWETLFSIPANSLVTDIQVTDWDELNWTVITSRRARIRFVNDSFATVHSAGELFDVTGTPTNATGAPVAKGVGTSRAVDAAFQASATSVRIEFELTATTISTLDLDQDNVDVSAIWVPAGSVTPFVPHRMPMGV